MMCLSFYGAQHRRDGQQVKPNGEYLGETSSKQVFNRLAGAWAYWGWKGGMFDTEDDAQIIL